MTSPTDLQAASDGPSDDELVDYLLQPPAAAGDCGFADLERWLASDEANLIRLESIAESVLIAAGGLPRFDQHPIRSAAERPITPPRVRWAVLILAATLLLALGWRFGFFPADSATGAATQRVALAWSEIDSIGSLDDWEPAEEAAIDWEEPLPLTAWDVTEAITQQDDAEVGEAPPEWMLIAVTRMPLSELPDGETIDDQPEKRR